MTATSDPFSAVDRLHLEIALRQPTDAYAKDRDGWCPLTPEALRCLRLLLVALQEMPPAHDGPAERHLRWATVTRLRARQALLCLPEDPTAPRRPLPVRVRFGSDAPLTGDRLFDTILPDQTWLRALRDDVECTVSAPDCEDARSTAETLRDLVRVCDRYLTELELGHAAGVLGFTCDGEADGRC